MIMSNEAVKSSEIGKSGKSIIIIILMAIVIASLIFLYFFNIGGIRDNTSKLLNSIFKKSADKEVMQEKETQKAMEQIELEKEKILYAQAKLNDAKLELDTKQKELENRETELLEREKEIDQLEEQLSQKVEDIKIVSKLYEQMDAQRAAEILTELENMDTIIAILKNVKKENTAEILENMDPKTAANITNMMLD